MMPLGLIPGRGGYTSGPDDHLNVSHRSLGPIPSGRLKNPGHIDRWSSLGFCILVKGMSVTRRLGLYFGTWDG